MHMIAEGMEAWSNDYFKRIRRYWMLMHLRAHKKDIVQLYNHYSTTLLLMSAVVQDNGCDYAGCSLFLE